MDKKSLYKLTYGLYILSAPSETPGGGAACVINTAAQVTSEPPRMTVTVSKNNCTHAAVEKQGVFAVSVLTKEAPLELFQTFGFRTSDEIDKFAGFESAADAAGIRYLTQYCAARFSCKVMQKVDLGTHTMFIGDILEGETVDSAGEPITYSYYQAAKKGGTPKNAPSYQAPQSSIENKKISEDGQMKRYVCQVCGYVYDEADEGVKWDDLPDDYTCPMCGVGKDMFEEEK